ncbi:hypothetical protein RN96_10910 [Fusobacterium polymorphum]|uniref:Uncharacterized protein n=1 Tax=Fusobacterium nucleatum subsp. polymorphum TaxID=76857 RepID=A0A2B7YII5_FUSNP|nr:hypothetical protein [Fusobacterium polymorphum]PGH20658.1 hypothetical protein RN96_10910 [Fusobacterium polymorphum]
MKKLLILLFRILFNRKSKVDSSTIDGENVKRVLYNSRTKDIFKVKMIDGGIVLYENGKYQAFYKNENIKEELDFANNVKNGIKLFK